MDFVSFQALDNGYLDDNDDDSSLADILSEMDCEDNISEPDWDDEDDLSEMFEGLLDVKFSCDYWNQLVQCRDSLFRHPSVKFSMRYVSALSKFCVRYPKAFQLYSISYSVGVFLEYILPKIKGDKRHMNPFQKQLRDLVQMVKSRNQQTFPKQQLFLPSSTPISMVLEVTIYFKNKKLLEKIIFLIFSFLCSVEKPSTENYGDSIDKIIKDCFPENMAGPYGPYRIMIPVGWLY